MRTKPTGAAGAVAPSQSVLAMSRKPGIQPGGGIAEAFARIVPPEKRSPLPISGPELEFAPFCAPAQFPARPAAELGCEQSFPIPARSIRKAHPNEMENLV